MQNIINDDHEISQPVFDHRAMADVFGHNVVPLRINTAYKNSDANISLRRNPGGPNHELFAFLSETIARNGTLGCPEAAIEMGGGREKTAQNMVYLLQQGFDALRAAPILADGMLLNGLSGLCQLAGHVFSEPQTPGREAIVSLLRQVAADSEHWHDLVGRVLKREGSGDFANPIAAALYAWLLLDAVPASAWWWHFNIVRRRHDLGNAQKAEALLLLLSGGAQQMREAEAVRVQGWAKLLAQGFTRWVGEQAQDEDMQVMFKLGLHNLRHATGERWGALLERLVEDLPVAFGGLSDLGDDKLVSWARSLRDDDFIGA